MVWPITGAESYVQEEGESMKAIGLPVAKIIVGDKIAVVLGDRQACVWLGRNQAGKN
jgi:hypothetical protein